jgi:hypothetical protein
LTIERNVMAVLGGSGAWHFFGGGLFIFKY